MRRTLRTASCAASILVISAHAAYAHTSPGALKVDVFGASLMPEAQVYDAVMRLTGNFLSQGRLQKFIAYGWGIEGGISFCIEASSRQAPSTLGELAEAYQQVPFNPELTLLRVQTQATCP